MNHTKKHKLSKRISLLFLCLLLGTFPAGAILAEPVAQENIQDDTFVSETQNDTENTDNTDIASDGQEASSSENPVRENLDFETDAAMRTAEPIQSNEIPGWPPGPVVGAQGAILIEAETGTILYAKNIHEKLYPASTTKILTSLVAYENCDDLSEMVEFSQNAVFSIEKGSSNMGMDSGQSITMEQCLHGILIMSANEVCNAVAEHVSGSIEAFVDKMNEKAKELGCLNSNFVTTNGLQDPNHYTTAYDLAQIGRAFFANETLAKISGIRYEVIEPTATQPDTIELYTHNELTKGTYACEGYIGGKTGYTSMAHQTLVTCAERGGMKLICVVMKEDSPMQFTDTVALFDYGFNNFQKCRISDYETKYTVSHTDFFESGNQVFGDNETIMSIDPNGYVILPSTITFDDADSEISFSDTDINSDTVAEISYSYQGIPIGSASVRLAENSHDVYDFDSPALQNAPPEEEENIIFVNVIKIILIVVCILVLFVFLIILRSVLKDYHFTARRRKRNKIKFRVEKDNTRRFRKQRIRRSRKKERKNGKNRKGLHF